MLVLYCEPLIVVRPQRTARQRLFYASASPPRAALAPAVELLVLDFDHGLSAGRGGLQARGLAGALSHTSLPFYILADDADVAAQTLASAAGVQLPPSRIVPRSRDGVLELAARPLLSEPGVRCNFVSADSALLACAAAERSATQSWRLLRAGWLPSIGSTPHPPEAAELTLDALVELLNFGLLMGVGDGCQETYDLNGNELGSN
jgi:hypothetical protein